MAEDIENITRKGKNEDSKKEDVYELPKIKKKKSFFRKLTKFVFILSIILVVILATFIIFIQTSFFKNWALHYAVDKLNESFVTKETTISAESIGGSIFRDLSLINVSVVTKKDTLIKFDKIELDYFLPSILYKRISVYNLIIFRPQVNLTKVRDRNDSLIWNFEYVLKPEKPKEIDTSKKEFDWDVRVENLIIFRCNFRILENKGKDIPIRNIDMPFLKNLDLSNLDVQNFNVNLSAHYSPYEKNVKIKSMNFTSNSDLNLRTFSCEAFVDKKEISGIDNLNLQTDRSNVIINEVGIKNLNPLKDKIDIKEFEDKEMYVNILTNEFDAEDLKFFTKDVNFLGGRVFMDLNAKGKFGNFFISKLELNTGKTSMNINGRVMNLNDPSKLLLDVKLNNVQIDPNDTKIMIPGLNIPDYSNLGIINADINFKGEPVKFDAVVDVRTSAGNVNGKSFLDVSNKEIVYKADFSTTNIDIGKIVKDDKLKSVINSKIVAEGKGVDYKTMVNKINFEITNTSFLGQNISKSNGVINSNNGSFDVNFDYESNSLNTKVEGNINISDLSNIKYDVKGTAHNLDISSFTNNPGSKSNLNFDFNINGSGYDPDKILGNLQFNIFPSNYADFIIPSTPLVAKFETNGEQRTISVSSAFLDVDAKGKFEFKTLPDIIASNLDAIIAKIKNQYDTDTLFLDKIRTFTSKDDLISKDQQTILPDMNLVYKLNIKDLTPLVHLTNDSTFTFNAVINGEVRNDVNNFRFQAEGDINNFKYGDSNLRFTKGKLKFDLTRGYYPYNNGFLISSLDFKSNKFTKGNIILDSLNYSLIADDSKNKFTCFGKADSNIFVNTAGSIFVGGKVVSLTLDTMIFRYFDTKVSSREKLTVSYKPGDKDDTLKFLRFDNFRLISSEDQRITIKGNYAFNDTSNLSVGLYRTKISDLQNLAYPDIEDDQLIKGNMRRMLVDFNGTIDDPHLHVEANTDVLSLQKFKLGRLDAIVDYRDNIAKPELSFYNPNNEGKLLISGEVPFKNPIKPTAEGEQKIGFLQNEVDLNILASNFQIKILEQIIPILSDLNGNLDGKIKVNGIVKNPVLTGDMTVKKGSFKVNMTGTRYNFLANLSTKDQRLIFQNVNINFPGEPDKNMIMRGYLDVSNLELNDLDLTLNGEIKIFDKEVAKNILGVYGDLYGKSDIHPLQIKANPDRMDLTGNLQLTAGRIYIPPFKKDAYNLYSDNYVYKVAFDSSSFNDDNLKTFLSKMQDSLKSVDKKRLDPFDNFFVKKNVEETKQAKKNTYFHYNITILTQDKIFTNLVIDDKTGQEFFGNVLTTLYFDNENDSLTVRGRVDLEDNSIYKFYKNFKASGHVQFTGSMVNPDLFIDGVYDVITRDPNDPNASREVVVTLNVRGETAKPKLRWSVTVNGVPVGGADPTDEAVSFIVFGKLKDELSAEQRISLVSSVGANVGSTIVSSYLSNVLQNYIPFLVNTDINYVDNQSGNVAQNTDIRFTAEIGYATIRFGGQVFKDLTNTNFTLEYPINKLWKFNSLSNNLIFQFERVVDPYSENSTTLTGSSRTGALVFYRIKF